MKAWGFRYKTNIIWHESEKTAVRTAGVWASICRNVTEMLLFGVRGKNARTLAPGRRPSELHEQSQA